MSRIRQVVGDGNGMAAWSGQLISAVMMLIVMVYIAGVIAVVQPEGFEGLKALIGANYFRVPASIGAGLIVWHAWLGAKSVLMDYIKWPWFRVVKYIGIILYLILILVWFVGVIWSI